MLILMSIKTFTTDKLVRRLLPLYIAAFFQGFVLWYAIEKLFMRSIGFDDAGIGVAAAAYSALLILVETPSGILADRWSRKGVLVIGSCMLGLSSLICGISTSPPLFFAGTLLWGVFFAMYSGTYDSIVYDTLVEERQDTEKYNRYYGYIRFLDSIALVLGSILGGLLSSHTLTGAFFWSIPSAIISIVALFAFREPKIHKAEPLGTVSEHLSSTFRAVLGKKGLITLLATLICTSLVMEILFDFYQLWLLETNTTAELYGITSATLTLSLGAAGLIAAHARNRHTTTLIAALCLLSGSIILLFSHQLAVIVIAQFSIGTGATILSIIFTKDLHDKLSSRVRAGASSAVNTFSRIIFVPVSLLFGAISSHKSVFVACFMLTTVAGITFIFERISSYRYAHK